MFTLSAFIILLSTTLFAENLSLHGLTFPVDELSVVDGKSSRITLAGKTKLIETSLVEEEVAQYHFSTTALSDRFSVEQIEQFIRGVLGDSRKLCSIDCAVYALEALSRDKREQGIALIEKLASVRGASELFERLIERGNILKDHELTVRLLIEVGIHDPAAVQGIAPRLTREHSSAYLPIAKERLQRLVSDGAFDQSEDLVAVTRVIFGESSEQYRSQKDLVSNMRKATTLAEDGDFTSVYSILSGKKGEYGDAQAGLLVKAIHGEAQRSIAAGRYDTALSVLTGVELTRRTETTHNLVRAALGALTPSATPVFADIRVELMLRGLSDKDAAIKQGYINALVNQLHYFIKERRSERIDQYLEKLLRVRPDPQRENDQIRLEIVHALIAAGDKVAARARLAEISEISFWQRLKLLIAGLYIDPTILLALFALPFMLVLAVGYRSWFAGKPAMAHSSRAVNAADLGDREGADLLGARSTFKPNTSRLMRDPELEEYEAALALFGLTTAASSKEIKLAYRSVVKEYHPDANPESANIASERFIELTQAYERIMDIYQKRFAGFKVDKG